MTNDWYNVGSEKMFALLADETGVDEMHVRLVYSHLMEYGFIDYDIEKEAIWNMFYEDGEDDA